MQIPGGEKLDLSIIIRERKEKSFKGTYTTKHNDGRRYEWTIEGDIIQENEVNWRFTKCLTRNHNDTMDNYYVTGHFDGTKLGLTLRSDEKIGSDMWVRHMRRR